MFMPSRVIKSEPMERLEETNVDLSKVKEEPVDYQEMGNAPGPSIEATDSTDERNELSSQVDTSSIIAEEDSEYKEGPALYLCEHCELSTGVQWKLIKHYRKKHRGVCWSPKAYWPTCSLCFKYFKTEECVRIHRDIVHRENEGIACDEDCQLHEKQLATLDKFNKGLMN